MKRSAVLLRSTTSAILGLFGGVSSIDAAQVTYQFTGTTSFAMNVDNGTNVGSVPAGTQFTGTLVFDNAQTATAVPFAGGTHSTYVFTSMTITIGVSSASWGPGVIDVYGNLTSNTGGYPIGDSFYANLTSQLSSQVAPNGLIGGAQFNWVGLGLVDPTGTAFTGSALPANLNFRSFQNPFMEFNYYGTVGTSSEMGNVSVLQLLSSFNNTSATTALPPTISGLMPSSGKAGSSAFTLTVNGAGFAPGSVAEWNGTALPTTFVSNTTLTATVGTSLIANAGLAHISVLVGGVASAPAIFTIYSPTNASLSISGNWQIASASSVFTSVVNGISGNTLLDGAVTEIGGNVSGAFTNYVGWTAGLMGVVSEANQLTATLAYSYYYGQCEETVALTGTVSMDGNSASGTYTAPANACAQADYGTWGGTRPSFDGVTNSASFAKNANGVGSAVAPGSLITIFGTVNPILACFCFNLPNFGIVATDDFGTVTGEANTIPFPTSLGGVSVTINGVEAPLVSLSSGQLGVNPFINAQIPFEAIVPGEASETATLIVTTTTPIFGSNGFTLPAGFAFPPVSIQILPAAPGIFTTTANGLGQAILVNLANYQIATPSNPIPRGGKAYFYATGLGALQPAVADGAGSPASPAIATPTVFVGGITAQVIFAGQAPGYPGVNQINIVIPNNAPTGNAVPIQIQTADGSVLSNVATIAIQ